MKNFDSIRRTFSNHRQWREFIAAIHDSVNYPCPVTYPNVIGALRMGRPLNVSLQKTSGARDVSTRCSASRVEIPPMSIRMSLQD
jgi:hypothetical protein